MSMIDLSHTVEDGMITYKGLPAPIICDYLSREASKASYAEGTSFHIGKIEMIANTGTYIDAPFHRYSDGKDLSQLELQSIAELAGVLVDASAGQTAIGPECFSDVDLQGKAVLVHTGWSRHWRTDQYYENHPYLTEAAASLLKSSGVSLVGIDSHNIDDTSGNERPVHSTLLGADIPIVEHLCHLQDLIGKAFRFSAVPVKVRQMGTFPVRAYAVIDTDIPVQRSPRATAEK